MTKAKTRRLAVLWFTIGPLFLLAQDTKADDFGSIVHHIEAEYHVHRNYRFLMFTAGVVVKCSHVGGAKVFKMALFEDQHVEAAELDGRLDELVERAGASGWQPLVKSVSRRSGEHTYIYAQSKGKDLKLLLVSVEPDETVVLELKVDPAKLSDFVNKHSGRAD
jgi:hypothetical protein